MNSYAALIHLIVNHAHIHIEKELCVKFLRQNQIENDIQHTL